MEWNRHGTTERVDAVIHWHGGSITRHEIRQGLRTYESLGGLAKLRERTLELRGEGRIADAIAEVLNAEGYQVARGTEFTGALVRQLLARFGQAGVPAGVRNASDLPGTNEWWLGTLAKHLGLKPIIVHRWRWSGWLHARQLRAENGRWIVWADAEELDRLRHLRAFEIEGRGRRKPLPELTKPGSRTDLRDSTKKRIHTVEGNDASFKYQEIYLRDYSTVADVEEGLRLYFEKYNHERPHQSLDNLTPAKVYEWGAEVRQRRRVDHCD